jgi:hypothetical protein
METLLFGDGAISLEQIDPYQGLELAPKVHWMI